jgi:phage-related protein
MASTSRALTLKLLADVDNFTKGLDKGAKETKTFGDKITKFGKIAGAAFAVAGAAAVAYAGKLLKDGVESAIADEKANAQLAVTLRNVAGATDETIAKTLEYTRATELATGVTEDELRPSLNRLSIATGDVSKAMELQKLALDVSAGSGKSLETVTNALAKAQEGNTASLVRLGIGLSAAQLKTMSMDDVTNSLAETFAGAADTAANTFEGKMTRLGLAFEDVRDTVGGFVLDAITPMVETIVSKVMPALASFADSLGGKEGLKGTFDVFVNGAKNLFIPIFNGIRSAFNSIKSAVMDNKEEFTALFNFLKNYVAPFLGGALRIAIQGIGAVISTVVNLVADLVRGFQSLISFGQRVGGVIGSVGGFLGFGGRRAMGGPVAGNTAYVVGERGPELFVPQGSGTIIPNNRMGGGGTTINLTVNGAIDAEGTARTIIDVLNRSQARGTLGSAAFA